MATVDEVPRFSALQKMPIKELTVFKDGHAFVLHEGAMPTDKSGNVLLDYLPTPVKEGGYCKLLPQATEA